MSQVFINGRFLGQRVTGVQRFAREVLRHMDAALQADAAQPGRLDCTLLTPSHTPPSLELNAIRTLPVGRFQGHLWEQLELAGHAGRHLLVNLCNTAPLRARNMISTVYDASVFARPEAYSRAFRLWYRILIPAIGRRSRTVVTASRFSRGELGRYARIPAEAFTVIPGSGEHILDAPAEERILDRLGLEPRRYVLAVNSHSPHKNVAGFARAANLLQDLGYDFVLAGGANTRVFRQTLPGWDRSLRVTGYVSDGELRAVYQSAACFVYPSFYEGFGLPPLEAMACGCPVVVSRAASLPEVCGDAAVYCDPADPTDIARALRRVLTDTGLQEDLRRRSLQRSREFSWGRAARALLNLIRDLAG